MNTTTNPDTRDYATRPPRPRRFPNGSYQTNIRLDPALRPAIDAALSGRTFTAWADAAFREKLARDSGLVLFPPTLP